MFLRNRKIIMSKSCLLRFAVYDSGNRDENYWTWTDEALPESTQKDFYYNFLANCGVAGIVRSRGYITIYRSLEGGYDPQMRTGRRVLVTAWLGKEEAESSSPGTLWSLLNADFWEDFSLLARQNPVPTPTWGTRKNVAIGKVAPELPFNLKTALDSLSSQISDAHLKLYEDVKSEISPDFSAFEFQQNSQNTQSSQNSQADQVIQTAKPEEPPFPSPFTESSTPQTRMRRWWFGGLAFLATIMIFVVFLNPRSENARNSEIDVSHLEYPIPPAPPEERELWTEPQLKLRQEIRGWERWCQELADDVNLVLYRKAPESSFFAKYPMFSGKSPEFVQRWAEEKCTLCSQALLDMETLSTPQFKEKYDSFFAFLNQTHSETYRRISSRLEARRRALDAMESDFQRVGRDLTLDEFMHKYPEL